MALAALAPRRRLAPVGTSSRQSARRRQAVPITETVLVKQIGFEVLELGWSTLLKPGIASGLEMHPDNTACRSLTYVYLASPGELDCDVR